MKQYSPIEIATIVNGVVNACRDNKDTSVTTFLFLRCMPEFRHESLSDFINNYESGECLKQHIIAVANKYTNYCDIDTKNEHQFRSIYRQIVDCLESQAFTDSKLKDHGNVNVKR